MGMDQARETLGTLAPSVLYTRIHDMDVLWGLSIQVHPQNWQGLGGHYWDAPSQAGQGNTCRSGFCRVRSPVWGPFSFGGRGTAVSLCMRGDLGLVWQICFRTKKVLGAQQWSRTFPISFSLSPSFLSGWKLFLWGRGY